MQHSFDIEIAQTYGVPVAIFLNNLAFWIKKNQANRKHFHDGRYWTYNSVEAYQELFPYWTTKQMRTVLDKLAELGLILKGNYNSTSYDRTLWYALSDEGHNLLGLPICPLGEETICPKGQINLTRRANQFDKKGEPIPDALKAPEKLIKERAFKSSCATSSKTEHQEPEKPKSNYENLPEKPKRQKPKASRKDMRAENEQKHHWADKVKVCEPVTADPVICSACRRPDNHCECNAHTRLPPEIYQALSAAAWKKIGVSKRQ